MYKCNTGCFCLQTTYAHIGDNLYMYHRIELSTVFDWVTLASRNKACILVNKVIR